MLATMKLIAIKLLCRGLLNMRNSSLIMPKDTGFTVRRGDGWASHSFCVSRPPLHPLLVLGFKQ